MNPALDRRDWLLAAGSALGATAMTSLAVSAETTRSASEPFGYCLNTSTIRGQNLSIVDEIKLAAEAGYSAIEPWIRELDQYVKDGGSLSDLRKRIDDSGLKVVSAIGFAEWIVDDDAKRAAGMEEARRNFDMLEKLGGQRLAAPPVGAVKTVGLDLTQAAQRYRELCELGKKFQIVPQVEVWGFSTTLGKISESMFVALESGHPQACLLPDIYHLHKGGSSFDSLRLLSGQCIQVFHVNDYPAEPPRAEITDAHRVYPGDGVAPLKQVFRTLRDIGFGGYLSLELFNRDYWQQDARQVVKTGLSKMRDSVQAALA